MASQLQLRRGTTVQHVPFIGAPAEVTVDTDKKTLVVHDGTTPGGFPSATAAELAAGLTTKVSVGAAAGGALSGTYPNPTLAPVIATGSTTPRFLADRFAERLNILDFGADPTGVNSSRNAFIAALAAASNGGTIYMPKGTYSGFHGITINKAITIVGDGKNTTIIESADVQSEQILQQNGGTLAAYDVANHIFWLTSPCNKFCIEDITMQWSGGFSIKGIGNVIDFPYTVHPSGALALDASITLLRSDFRNFSNIVRTWVAGRLIDSVIIENCGFYWKHGLASLRMHGLGNNRDQVPDKMYDFPMVMTGTARKVYLRNNIFDGLEDPTFTGVSNNAPAWSKTPPDGFYKAGSGPYEEIIIENNIIKNFGIEGIFIERGPISGSNDNPNDGSHKSTCIIRGNSFIGPEIRSDYFTQLNPAISFSTPHQAVICDNYFSNVPLAVAMRWVESAVPTFTSNGFFCRVTATASDNKLTVLYRWDNRYPSVDNDSRVRIIFKNGGAGIENNKTYYVVDAEALVENAGLNDDTRTFRISETLGGSPVDITTDMTAGVIIADDTYDRVSVNISNNTVVDCPRAFEIYTMPEKWVTIENNFIKVASEPVKSRQGWTVAGGWNASGPPISDTSLRPLSIYGGATIKNNVIRFTEPAWDGVFDLVSKNSNVWTLGAGQVAALNSLVESINGSPVYGYFTAWSATQWFYLPITAIDVNANTVTISSEWSSAAGNLSSGKLYYTNTTGFSTNSPLFCQNNGDNTVIFENNTVFDALQDQYNFGNVSIIMAGNNFQGLKTSPSNSSAVTRRASLETLGLYQGSGAPSVSATNGSIFLRTDGDASTSLYVRASGAWTPLASWNP